MLHKLKRIIFSKQLCVQQPIKNCSDLKPVSILGLVPIIQTATTSLRSVPVKALYGEFTALVSILVLTTSFMTRSNISHCLILSFTS
jgi:hypothetical protein